MGKQAVANTRSPGGKSASPRKENGGKGRGGGDGPGKRSSPAKGSAYKRRRRRQRRYARGQSQTTPSVGAVTPDEVISYVFPLDELEEPARTNNRRRGRNKANNRTKNVRAGGAQSNVPVKMEDEPTPDPCVPMNCTSSPAIKTENNEPSKPSSSLAPINVSNSSIHAEWKKKLGGLIRYFAHGCGAGQHDAAMRRVEEMYTNNGCDEVRTRDAILLELDAAAGQEGRDYVVDGSAASAVDSAHIGLQEGWIGMSMAVEIDQDGVGKDGVVTNDDVAADNLEKSCDGKGLKLKVEPRPGVGPAHAGETMPTSIVPEWAVGKSYFVEIVNRSPLDLSCEMKIDGHEQVAKNAPIPAHTTRTIKPDFFRYCESHKWVLQRAERVKLRSVVTDRRPEQQEERGPAGQRTGPRYNGVRPDYKGRRVDPSEYPDPTTRGWTFTGSKEGSHVEYFEKQVNLGVVLLDFYYDNAIVEAFLEHPTTGRNQLFRGCKVDPATYLRILEDPRAHPNLERSTGDQPMPEGDVDDEADDPMEDADAGPTGASSGAGGAAAGADASGEDGNNSSTENGSKYYAKNEKYDFDKEGHTNRMAEMPTLQSTPQYKAWKQANEKDWSCIHARFYISLKKTRRRIMHGAPRHVEPLNLPPTAPIVDVKASENASYATKFHATGPKIARSSNVRMERISGLNDSTDWKSGPAFEYKLYYRADDGKGEGSDDEDVAMGDGEESESQLSAYKKAVANQVEMWHKDVTTADRDEAAEAYAQCRSKIQAAADREAIDDAVTHYWHWHQKQEFGSSSHSAAPTK